MKTSRKNNDFHYLVNDLNVSVFGIVIICNVNVISM